jgi:hypothetical protein
MKLIDAYDKGISQSEQVLEMMERCARLLDMDLAPEIRTKIEREYQGLRVLFTRIVAVMDQIEAQMDELCESPED